MGLVERITDPMLGLPDGVIAEIRSVVTKFSRADGIKSKKDRPCAVMCSYSAGTISFINKGQQMITIRVDELYEILSEASKASKDFMETVKQDAEMMKGSREAIEDKVCQICKHTRVIDKDSSRAICRGLHSLWHGEEIMPKHSCEYWEGASN